MSQSIHGLIRALTLYVAVLIVLGKKETELELFQKNPRIAHLAQVCMTLLVL